MARRGTAAADDAARLTARPVGDAPTGGPTGLHELEVAGRHLGLRYVPDGADGATPAGVMVLLHGAGGNGKRGFDLLAVQAERAGLILVSPDSVGPTWDLLTGGWGPDVGRIDAALADTFRRYAVDPAMVVIGGFSDGASYALSLGIANGDLFDAVVAFSPGFAAPPAAHGRPRVYVSHGVRDNVLPVDVCSRRLVPALQRAGYEVRYDEFAGGHAVPREIVDEALRWLAAPPADP